MSALCATPSAGSRDRTASITAQQATELARGPAESSVVDRGWQPSKGTPLAVGLNPTMPHRAAGVRQEPPVSVRDAANAIESVTDTAAPDEEPPGILLRSRSQGFSGVP